MVQLLVAFHSSTELTSFCLLRMDALAHSVTNIPKHVQKLLLANWISVCPQPSSAASPVLWRDSDHMFMSGVKLASFLCVKREKDEALKEANLRTQEMQQPQCFLSTEGWILPSACTPA